MIGSPIDFYFDPISPFSYLATTQIDRLAGRHGRTVEWHPLLVGITMTKVMGLKPIPDTPLKSTYSWMDAERQAAMLGVPLRRHGLKNINSLAACRAYLWLGDNDPALARELVKRISARLWVDGEDITRPEFVLSEAAAFGADVQGLEQALAAPELKERLMQAVDKAIARGVFGVPFFFVDGEALWGCDRLWMLDFKLATGRWPTSDEWVNLLQGT
ncbi:2-hydroxychromene-2-carboxylate isomerase [Neorhizobium sp. DT-125]|uniref:2-hydroxychromene-2-carboxylate isomerase n=1 Tax=Neorhizobium sp. DT-125 TaxID=3396163 RepID=UPI003F1B8E44